MSKVQSVKQHLREHKITYSCVATGVVVAGITVLIMRGRHAGVGDAASDGLEKVTVRPLSILSNKQTVVTVIQREGRGHPGYIIRCLETGDFFLSQGEAATNFGIHKTVMSRHLNGILDNAGGYHFERLGFLD